MSATYKQLNYIKSLLERKGKDFAYLQRELDLDEAEMISQLSVSEASEAIDLLQELDDVN